MLNKFLVLAAACAFAASPALAQSAAPAAVAPSTAAPAATPAPAPSAPDLTKDGKPTMKFVRDECRTEVQNGGLKGAPRKQAMADCIIKQRPDMEARVKCGMDPSLKGMDKDAKRAAVKACIAKTKG